MTKRLLSFFTAVIMLLSMNLPFSASAASPTEVETELSTVSTANWMSAIRGETTLAEITVPGTHNSGAQYFEGFYGAVSEISQCQDKTVPEQLNMGIRFLDIRVEAHGESDDYYAFLTHGTTTVRAPESGAWGSVTGGDKYFLDRLFKEVYSFLDAHPSETVLMSFKKDKGDYDIATSLYHYIHGTSYKGSSYYSDIYPGGYNWKDYWYLDGGNPTLDDVRGKIVLFNRYNFDYDLDETKSGVQSGVNIDWNDQGSDGNRGDYTDEAYCYALNKKGNGYIQDRYEWNPDSKVLATQDMLNLSHTKGMWYVSFSSCAERDSTYLGVACSYPDRHAKKINYRLPDLTFTPNKPSGIYPMDFAGGAEDVGGTGTPEYIRKLIENNEAVSNIVKGTDGNISYTLNRKTKTLTISGSGAMKNYAKTTGVGVNNDGATAPWGDQAYNALYNGQYNTDIIENLVIEDGVTSIGDYAFYGYDHLTSVTLPASLTAIGANAFEGCSALTSFDISDTAVTTVGDNAFKGNAALTTFYTAASVSSFGENTFADCIRLQTDGMYGPWGVYSNTYADAHSIPYHGPLSVHVKTGNTVYEPVNPFAGKDLSQGITISFSQYFTETDKGRNASLINFSTGVNKENEYFFIGANGTMMFNDGTNGIYAADSCFFDIDRNRTFTGWADIDITVDSNHLMTYYVDGEPVEEFKLKEVGESGYLSNGHYGGNGIFSYLASEDVNLYYGASFSKDGGFAGTSESYLDNVAFYTRALSADEIKQNSASDAFFTNNFDSDTLNVKSGDSAWLVGYKEHPGVLHFPEADVNGNFNLYVKGNPAENDAIAYQHTSIAASYSGTKNIAGWQTAVRNANGTFTTGYYNSSSVNFSLNGDTILNAVFENNASAYQMLNFSKYDEYYARAKQIIDDEDAPYQNETLKALKDVMASDSVKKYAPENGTAHTVTLYDTYQNEIDNLASDILKALNNLKSASDFGDLDLAFSKGEQLLDSLDGAAPMYTEDQIRALRTALNNAKVYEGMTKAERKNLDSKAAQAEINRRTDAINKALESIEKEDVQGVDVSTYRALVQRVQSLDLDVYDFEDGELEAIIEILSLSLSGDSIAYSFLDSTKNAAEIQTISSESLTQDDVDAVNSILLSSLTEHIRMYNVAVAEGTAAVGFSGNGKSKGPDASGVYKTTYNSTAVFTADTEETAWYMEYVSNTTSRTKQYQAYGEKFATPVLGSINVYAVSRNNNYKVSILRDYSDDNRNHPTQLVDFVDGSFALPSSPAIPYYTFDGYYIDGQKVEGTISITEDTEIRAKYIADDTKNCAITVKDTNGSELFNDTVKYNKMIMVKDDNAYAWVEQVGDNQYRPFWIGHEMNFFAVESTTILAVTQEQFNAYGFRLPAVSLKQNDALVTYNNNKTRTTFNGQLVEEGSNITLEYGVLIGKATTGTISAENLTVENSGTNNGYTILRAKSTKKVGANQFTITVGNITGGIYYRGYIIYQTPSGEIKTDYTDVKYQAIE